VELEDIAAPPPDGPARLRSCPRRRRRRPRRHLPGSSCWPRSASRCGA